MTPTEFALVIGLGCVFAHVALTLVLLRLPGEGSPVKRHALAGFLSHLAGVLVATSLDSPVPYWPLAAVSAFGVVLWLFLFCAVYKSVSLRVLTTLRRAPADRLPFSEITQQHVRKEFEDRVEVLTSLGWAHRDTLGYVATPKGRAAASRITWLQRFWGIGHSGLYSDHPEGGSLCELD